MRLTREQGVVNVLRNLQKLITNYVLYIAVHTFEHKHEYLQLLLVKIRYAQ